MKLNKAQFKIFAVIIGGLFVWSAHRFLYELAGIAISKFGVTSPLMQNGVLILIFGGLLILYGTDIMKLFK